MFQQLRRLQTFKQQYLAHFQSPVANSIIIEIGYHQERGQPLTVKGLILLNLGAPATVRRHLQRLVHLGLVHKRRVRHDGRSYQLEVDSVVRQAYAKYLKLISRL